MVFPTYDNNDDLSSCESNVDIYEVVATNKAFDTNQDITTRKENNSCSEYEDDVFQEEKDMISNTFLQVGKKKIYTMKLNVNALKIQNANSQNNSYLLFLQDNEELCLFGSACVQIVKGGIVYNTTHYNASWKVFTIWQSTSNAISTIKSSYFTSFSDINTLFFNSNSSIKDENADLFEKYPCIIKISNNGIMQSLKKISSQGLTSKFLKFWELTNINESNNTFQLLKEDHLSEEFGEWKPALIDYYQFTTFDDNNWKSALDRLYMKFFDSTNSVGLRVMTIGGKNSGKSTFNRILLEKIFHKNDDGSNNNNNKELMTVNYIDLDPGQPEFSVPNCISSTELNTNSYKHLGNPIIVPIHNILQKTFFIGSPSPNEQPIRYLKLCEKLIDDLFQTDPLTPCIINLTGWIKGFGIQILNEIIKAYKPTDIILLESQQQGHTNGFHPELDIPDLFINEFDLKYKPSITKLPGCFNSNPTSVNSLAKLCDRWNATLIREYKLLTYFHRTDISEFDFTPLIEKVPLRVSFGGDTNNKGLITGFHFINDDIDLRVLTDNFRTFLEGSILSIFSVKNESYDKDQFELYDSIPILKNFPIDHATFLTLSFIHSVNVKEKYVNLYIPEICKKKMENLRESTNFIMIRGNIEVPTEEIIPNDKFITRYCKEKKIDFVPYISFKQKRPNEHVWKVRKNIKRKSHFTK
ncbi:polynucleotide 5'-hydroxyl-kinase SCDLUD_001364 [Saccharomycodes ludwigii]|uniref:polynucleotide 5'-hydroxyl-kinase n=1 Tax=Saccharomycodes ludwigii TaxID=36035 RepID=UPI001E8BF5F6|nr:hypothetical protein SCDLUD_001364 [Saccharomycodes ludwigii]KAH3901600.1 hypothetical protein SCDLUD_001364 [Saccharomycodes ludwigii]